VLLVDPHRDLAEGLLGVVPRERVSDVVFLDAADRARPFGLNLLDTGLGWTRDRAVNNALAVFKREWGDRYWGPRMEDAFRYALMTLFEVNAAVCRDDPAHGRGRQHTLLEVPTVLSDKLFRRELLSTLDHPTIQAWWSDYFDSLERRFQLEVINPVLSKIHRFEGSTVARQIVSHARQIVSPAASVAERREDLMTFGHEIFSLFVPSDEAFASVGTVHAVGRVFPNSIGGAESRSAFLAFSETWIRP
jgi:hypothetical protein